MAVVPDALRSHWPDQQSWPPSYRGYPAAGLDGPDPGPSDFDAEILHLSRQITGSYPQLSGAAAAGPASAAAHFSSKLGKPAPPEKHSRSSHYSPWLFKTELCEKWSAHGKCPYGTRCLFAHGVAELRPVQRHPKYKTQPCHSFAKTGQCPFGERCRFLHGMQDMMDMLAEENAAREAARYATVTPQQALLKQMPQQAMPHFAPRTPSRPAPQPLLQNTYAVPEPSYPAVRHSPEAIAAALAELSLTEAPAPTRSQPALPDYLTPQPTYQQPAVRQQNTLQSIEELRAELLSSSLNTFNEGPLPDLYGLADILGPAQPATPKRMAPALSPWPVQASRGFSSSFY